MHVEHATLDRYKHLLSPGKIGSLELRNRIVMCPMGDNLAQADGFVSNEQMDYFEARARGGAGLILVGSVSVTFPDGTYNPFQAAVSDDRFIPRLRELSDRVHHHGARIALQLSHGGKGAVQDMAEGRPLMVPSKPGRGVPDPLMGMVTSDEGAAMSEPFRRETTKVEYHEMTDVDIATLVQRYADAVDRAQRAGFDGVELHAGHGYLIDQFLSPASNSRTDRYGGSLENRARLLLEVIAAVRARVGREFPLWCRINGEERLTEGGTTLEDAVRTAELCEAAGVDALHVSAYADPGRAIGCTVSHTTNTPGSLVELAATIRDRVRVPIITVGRIEPEVADQLIAEETVDFVAMGRKLLADPDLPNKLGAGRSHDVRPCVYHYRCIGQIFLRRGVRCAVNPTTGRERELALKLGVNRRRVAVIGGGPAGMESARLAAMSGHDVVLFERDDELGGLLRLAAKTYEPYGQLLEWLHTQVSTLDIDTRLGVTVTPDQLGNEAVDVAIVATGAVWGRPGIPGADLDNVYAADQLGPFLDGSMELGERIVVLGGGRTGLALADFARNRGLQVTVLEESRCFAPELGLPGRWQLVHDLREAGVTLIDRAVASEIDASGVHWRNKDGEEQLIPADAVFATAQVESDRRVANDLSGRVTVQVVGDCAAPAYIEGAMTTSAEVAIAL